jgi:hypothetical protein
LLLGVLFAGFRVFLLAPVLVCAGGGSVAAGAGAELLVAAPVLVELLLPQPASATTSPTITPTRSVAMNLNMYSPLLQFLPFAMAIPCLTVHLVQVFASR